MTETRASEGEEAAYEIEWCRKCGAIRPMRMNSESGLIGAPCPADNGVHEPERFVPDTLLTQLLEAVENARMEITHGPTANWEYIDQQLAMGRSIRAKLSDTKDSE